MEIIFDALHWLTQLFTPYQTEVALTLVATTLVIYGDVINKHIKLMLKPYPFILRTLVFVLVCAFGYGMVIVFLTPFIQQGISIIPTQYRGISIICVFLLMGYLAEHRRYI